MPVPSTTASVAAHLHSKSLQEHLGKLEPKCGTCGKPKGQCNCSLIYSFIFTLLLLSLFVEDSSTSAFNLYRFSVKEVVPIEEYIRNGTIVPVQITYKLLENAINAAGDVIGFLIDGFPRNQENLEGWQKEMGDKANVQFVLFLSCPVETCINRCLDRGQERTDDNRESLEKRVNTYNKQTLPVVEHFRGFNVVKMLSTEKDAEEVYAEVAKAFNAVA